MGLLKKIHLFFIILVVLLSFQLSGCSGPAAVRILFLGNSLTYVNDLPGMLAQMAKSKHHNIGCDMYAPGGYTLKQHSTDKAALDKINKGNWDFVVLQEQSQLPALSTDLVNRDVFPYAGSLCASIRAASPNAHIIFYMTMARKNGDSANSADVLEVATYFGMQSRINNSYFAMARDNRAMTAPIGVAWANALQERPDINLYGDEVHPNPAGTYLAACVFYHVIFNESAVGLSYPASVDDATASYLQATADRACLENKWNWENR